MFIKFNLPKPEFVSLYSIKILVFRLYSLFEVANQLFTINNYSEIHDNIIDVFDSYTGFYEMLLVQTSDMWDQE